MRLQPRQWDARRGCVTRPFRAKPSVVVPWQQRIDRDLCLLHTIIRDFEFRQEGYSLREWLSIGFASPGGAPCSPMSKRRPQGSRRTGSWGRRATTGGHSGVSPISWGGRDIPFSLVDERLVGQYDDWLRRRGVVRNTVSFYMRILRAVYNRAVKEDVVPQADPFRHVYTGVDQTCKRAVGECRRAAPAAGSDAFPVPALARDIFIFSYCTRGMAFVDIAFLRNQDIVGDTIRYVRRKTGQRLVIRIEPCIAKLIGAMPVQGAYPAMFFRCSVRTIRSGRFPNIVRGPRLL